MISIKIKWRDRHERTYSASDTSCSVPISHVVRVHEVARVAWDNLRHVHGQAAPHQVITTLPAGNEKRNEVMKKKKKRRKRKKKKRRRRRRRRKRRRMMMMMIDDE